MAVDIEQGLPVIPRGDDYSVRTTDIWMNECQQFGFVDGKLQGIGEHDDTVMAWWFCEEAIRAGGFSFAFGDDDDEGDEELLALFRDPFYQAMHMLYQQFGEDGVREMISSVRGEPIAQEDQS